MKKWPFISYANVVMFNYMYDGTFFTHFNCFKRSQAYIISAN